MLNRHERLDRPFQLRTAEEMYHALKALSPAFDSTELIHELHPRPVPFGELYIMVKIIARENPSLETDAVMRALVGQDEREAMEVCLAHFETDFAETRRDSE